MSNDRSRTLTAAGLLLLLLAAFLGMRAAARSLAAPFEGLERLAQGPKSPAPAPESEFAETIRTIDWDAPASGPAVRSARAKSMPAATPSRPASAIVRAELSLTLRASIQVMELREIEVEGERALLTWVCDIDVETLASKLKLSGTQKARIAALMEWRKWTLDSLTAKEKSDPRRLKELEEGFQAAVAMELDQVQAKDYEKLKSTGTRLSAYVAATLANEQVQTKTATTFSTVWENLSKVKPLK